MIFRRSFLSVCLFALPLSVGCANISGSDLGRFVQRDEKRFIVDGKPEVVLSTFDGSIEIRSWDGPDVLVIVEKRAATQSAAASIEVLSAQQGNRVSVEVETICVHGDEPTAVGVARHVRQGLEAAGCRVVTLPEMFN